MDRLAAADNKPTSIIKVVLEEALFIGRTNQSKYRILIGRLTRIDQPSCIDWPLRANFR